MGPLDAVLAEASNQFGISTAKSTSLLSGLLAMINEMPGGLGAFVDRLRKAGLGDFVSSWLGSGEPRQISSTSLEAAIGRDSIDKLASKAGLSYATAASALAFMVPKLVTRLAPGGVIPTHFSSDVLAYAGSATGAVAAGTRRAAQATERAAQKAGAPAWLWPVLALLGVFLVGYWIWSSRQTARNVAWDPAEQVRIANEKASSALAALKPGFSGQELVSALNLSVINFPSGSAQIPADSGDYLTRVAVVLKAAPAGTALEIGGHTDNTGDSAANMALSQQRADAVRVYLIQQGVNGDMLVAKGYGDTKPVGPNDTEEGKFHNRRIEFTLR
ncbi:MAG TPA: OmpA family protein [Candidatus Acidoferrum sp.]|jgi:outer membrane protein OmpA-like peptidoglycan-associated protein